MRKLFISLIALFTASSSLFAQDVNLKGFIFPKFTVGEVVMKNGGKNNTSLNYDAIYQRMMFRAANGEYFYLGDLEKVAVVVIDGHKFVPVKDEIFYEEIPLANNKVLYKQNKISITRQASSNVAYGAASQTTASQDVSHIFGGTQAGAGGSVNPGRFNFNTQADMIEIDKSQFLLYVEGKYVPVTSVKSVISALGHKAELTAFAKTNKTKFTNQEDVVKIVEYAYSL